MDISALAMNVDKQSMIPHSMLHGLHPPPHAEPSLHLLCPGEGLQTRHREESRNTNDSETLAYGSKFHHMTHHQSNKALKNRETNQI